MAFRWREGKARLFGEGSAQGGADEELPWVSEVKTVGKKPLIAGIAVACVLVLGIAAWNLASGAHLRLALTDTAGEASPSAEAQDADGALTATGLVYVHVVGAVAQPGVYGLDPSARVNDAVAAAGGFGEDADTDALNLARVVTDGEQICVPTLAETQAAAESAESAGTAGAAAGAASSAGTSMVVNGKVNINTADSATLQTLSGIGPSTAEKIIADRTANGPFASPEDLKRVSGIGDKKYAAIADAICVG